MVRDNVAQEERQSVCDKTVSDVVIFDTVEVMRIIPHRYPFLMVDKIIEFKDSEKIVGIKNVTMNEPFFQGHFPGRPVMPGVLVLEAMAQTAAILAHKSQDGVLPGKTVFLTGVSDVKWKKAVLPGDCLRVEMNSVRKRRPIWIMTGTVLVGSKLVASATLSAMEVD